MHAHLTKLKQVSSKAAINKIRFYCDDIRSNYKQITLM